MWNGYKLSELIERDGIRVFAAPLGKDIDETGWEHHAYLVNIERPIDGGYSGMSIPFKIGTGLTGSPTAADVMSSIVLEAQLILDENDAHPDGGFLSFEGWVAMTGYDEDSRQAERTYNAVKDEVRKLIAFLGVTKMTEYLEAEIDN